MPRASPPGQMAVLGWRPEDTVLHTGRRRMSTIRVRSAASYWLAVPAAAWMLGVVVVPIVLLGWVSLWGGRSFSPASPLTFDNYAKFFANKTYSSSRCTTVTHTVTLMAVTGVVGYAIAYFLTMKVKQSGLAAGAVPGLRRAVLDLDPDPRHRLGAVPRRQRRDQPGADVHRRDALADRGVPLFALGISMAQVSLYTMMAAGPVIYMLNSIAPQLREAAMTLKAPPFIVFWRIVFPLTLPGVVIGQVLVFLNVMADFATVATVGGNKHAMLPNLVLLFYEGSQHRAASVVAVLLMACMLIGVIAAMKRGRYPPPRSRAMKLDWKLRSNITGWVLGTLTVIFLAYQWLPILTLGLLSFAGPTGGTTFPMNGASFHWYEELWKATVMNDFKPPLLRSLAAGRGLLGTTIVLSVMAAQAMRGKFRGNGWFFYLMLLGIMAPGILVGFGFAIMMRLLGVELVVGHHDLPGPGLVDAAVRLPDHARGVQPLRQAGRGGGADLGASRLTTFRRITLPLILPGVIGAGLFGFSLSYDEYPRSMFTTGPDRPCRSP